MHLRVKSVKTIVNWDDNFICQLDWTKGYQIDGKPLFLGVFVGMFREDISICICRQNKEHPHQCEWVLSNPSRVRGREKIYFLLELGHLFCPPLDISLGHST